MGENHVRIEVISIRLLLTTEPEATSWGTYDQSLHPCNRQVCNRPRHRVLDSLKTKKAK